MMPIRGGRLDAMKRLVKNEKRSLRERLMDWLTGARSTTEEMW